MANTTPAGMGDGMASNGTAGTTRMRRLSQALPPLTMPVRENAATQLLWPRQQISRAEVIEEGKELFGHFLLEEMEKEGVETPETLLKEAVSTPESYANPAYAKVGRELKYLADDYERHKAKERQLVRNRASKIGEEMTEDEFKDLLSELLKEGITKTRILMLFLFCSDVLIHVLKHGAQAGLQLAQRFLTWSVKFIMDRVCDWVLDHGGWGKVFSSSMQYIQYAAAGIFVGFLCYVGIKRVIRMRS